MKKLLLHIVICFLASSTAGQQLYKTEQLPLFKGNFNEFAPSFYNDGILFCSDTTATSFSSKKDFQNHHPVKLYHAEQADGSGMARPELIKPVEKPFFNMGPLTYLEKEEIFYYTRNYVPGDRKAKKHEKVLGIFSGKIENGELVEMKAFEFNDPSYNLMHPSISKDGKKLFFSSDMRGGIGRYDIYLSEMVDGKWQEPKNLGKQVNTIYDDAFPYIHPSGRLFFSSRGHDGQGRLDIFYTLPLEEQTWSKPVNMGEPFNSRRDDFGIVVSKNLEEGYFSSDRKRISDDIYRFNLDIKGFDACEPAKETRLCYTFFDEGAINIDTAGFSYEWDMGDGTKYRKIEAKHCFEGPGTYFIQLNLVDNLTGEVKKNQANMMFELEEVKQPGIICPDTCTIKEEYLFKATEGKLDFKPGKYFWDFGPGDKFEGKEVSFRFAYPGTYFVKLLVYGNQKNDATISSACIYKEVIVLDDK